jgi:hypothetical protein
MEKVVSYGIETLADGEKILYYIWIFSMIFITLSTIASIIVEEDGLPKFRKEGNKLIRL